MQPVTLKPFYISPIWSGTRISELRGLPTGNGVTNGEAFDVSAHPTTMGVVESGACAGMPLDEFLAKHREEIMGALDDNAIIQITFMDCIDNLSVQVHPGEEDAQRLEGDHGKVESWYICAAEPGATLIAGCTTDDKDALRSAAADDTIGEKYGQRIEVKEGDFVLIPSGTMHALGPGIFCVEVGSFGNTTFRLCDWGRGRELHVDKGFEVLDTQSKPSVKRLGAFDAEGTASVRRGVETEVFSVDVVDVRGTWVGETSGRYCVLTCVGGSALVLTPEGDVELPYTRSCIIPATTERYTLRGNCRVLVSRRV